MQSGDVNVRSIGSNMGSERESNELTDSPFSKRICLGGTTYLRFAHAVDIKQGTETFNIGMFGAVKNVRFQSDLFQSRIFCGLEIVTKSSKLL
jgi:hypothetical protein